MKFKNKIIISFCIIIFVPIFLATLVLFSMQHIQMRAIEQTYGVEGDGYSYFSNSVQLLSRFTREIYREVYKVADYQPEKLEDGAYLEKINQQLEEKASYLIVRKGQELVYIGKSAGTSLLTELPEYGSADGNADSVVASDYIGKDGGVRGTIKQASDALEARELIKLKVLESSMYNAREASVKLAEATGADCVQVIGSKFVLYLQKKKESAYADLLK